MEKIIARIALIIKNKGISTRSFEMSIGASNGVIRRAISNNTDISAEWLAKIIESYPDVNAVWLLTGQGKMTNTDNRVETGETAIIDENKRFLDKYFHSRLLSSHYEYTMIKYYNAFSDKRIDELVSLEIDIYKERYSDYSKLVDFLQYLGPPEFFVEKFKSPPPFPKQLDEEREEFEEDVIGLSNDRLKNILYILRVKDQSEHFSYAISNIIKYLDTYKGILKSNVIYNSNKGEIE